MIMGRLLTMIGNIAHIVEPKSDEFALVWIIIRLFIAAINNKIEEEIAKNKPVGSRRSKCRISP